MMKLAGTINHPGKQNLNPRDKAADQSGILCRKHGVKHLHRLWKQNKSCCQQYFAGKKKVKEKRTGKPGNTEGSLG